MSPSPSHSPLHSPTPPKDLLSRMDSFRSTSPSHSVSVEHQIPNHPHHHIHTFRSPVPFDEPNAVKNFDNVDATYDDEAPPASISAQILAPILNAPVPSSFRSPSPSPLQKEAGASTNGLQSRGASARLTVLGSVSRSGSAKPHTRRRSNEDNALTVEYLDLIGDGHVDSKRMQKIRCLAYERGIPGHLRRVLSLCDSANQSTFGQCCLRSVCNGPSLEKIHLQTWKKISLKSQNV